MKTGDWISLGASIVTLFMAIATCYMAKFTKHLAEDTNKATMQADRHHQENVRPFCIILFQDGSREYPFGSDFDPDTRKIKALMAGSRDLTQHPAIHVRGEIQNKGNGPAKDVVVYLNTRIGAGEDDVFRLTRFVTVSGLVGSGERSAIDVQITEPDVIRTWKNGKWEPTQVFSAIASSAYEVVLEYQDVFGNYFRTVHSRGIFSASVPNLEDEATRERMMIQPGTPAPIFLTGTQSVRTLSDAPSIQQEFSADDQTHQL